MSATQPTADAPAKGPSWKADGVTVSVVFWPYTRLRRVWRHVGAPLASLWSRRGVTQVVQPRRPARHLQVEASGLGNKCRGCAAETCGSVRGQVSGGRWLRWAGWQNRCSAVPLWAFCRGTIRHPDSNVLLWRTSIFKNEPNPKPAHTPPRGHRGSPPGVTGGVTGVTGVLDPRPG